MKSKITSQEVRPPLIIIGMHRSGTTLLAQVLEKMGLFLGKYLDENHESLFFANLNNWLMRQCSAEWDYPTSFSTLFENSEVRAWTVRQLKYYLNTPRACLYLGFAGYLRSRTPFLFDQPWGWKDPRNTFTLPVWLALFPNAKVVHIYRHGVDVAQSLKVRAEKLFSISQNEKYHMNWLRFRPREATNTIRCLQLGGGFSLWEEYMVEAQRQVTRLREQAFEVRYETLLEDPAPWLLKLADFCGIACKKREIDNLVGRLHVDKAYGYRCQPLLREFAKKMAAGLKAWGYLP